MSHANRPVGGQVRDARSERPCCLSCAFFNLIRPLLALVYAWLGIKVLRLTPPAVTGEGRVSKG